MEERQREMKNRGPWWITRTCELDRPPSGIWVNMQKLSETMLPAVFVPWPVREEVSFHPRVSN